MLTGLASLAPVTAIRGNVDRGPWAQSLLDREVLQAGEAFIYVIHNIAELDLDPTAGFQAVVSGHSHQPGWREKDGVLYVNPGSAGPRRFKLPISVGRLTVAGTCVTAEVIDLGNLTSSSAVRSSRAHSRRPRPAAPRRPAHAKDSL